MGLWGDNKPLLCRHCRYCVLFEMEFSPTGMMVEDVRCGLHYNPKIVAPCEYFERM